MNDVPRAIVHMNVPVVQNRCAVIRTFLMKDVEEVGQKGLLLLRRGKGRGIKECILESDDLQEWEIGDLTCILGRDDQKYIQVIEAEDHKK